MHINKYVNKAIQESIDNNNWIMNTFIFSLD